MSVDGMVAWVALTSEAHIIVGKWMEHMFNPVVIACRQPDRELSDPFERTEDEVLVVQL